MEKSNRVRERHTFLAHHESGCVSTFVACITLEPPDFTEKSQTLLVPILVKRAPTKETATVYRGINFRIRKEMGRHFHDVNPLLECVPIQVVPVFVPRAGH